MDLNLIIKSNKINDNLYCLNIKKNIIFTNLNYNLIQDEIDILNKILNYENIFMSVICSQFNYSLPKICIIASEEMNLDICQTFKNTIEKGIFLQKSLKEQFYKIN